MTPRLDLMGAHDGFVIPPDAAQGSPRQRRGSYRGVVLRAAHMHPPRRTPRIGQEA